MTVVEFPVTIADFRFQGGRVRGGAKNLVRRGWRRAKIILTDRGRLSIFYVGFLAETVGVVAGERQRLAAAAVVNVIV